VQLDHSLHLKPNSRMEKYTNEQSFPWLSNSIIRSTAYVVSLLLLWIIVRFLFSTLSNMIKGDRQVEQLNHLQRVRLSVLQCDPSLKFLMT
jgi:flagellar biosynthesis/type III secretory pathway M-ring protein FliF/YscJ